MYRPAACSQGASGTPTMDQPQVEDRCAPRILTETTTSAPNAIKVEGLSVFFGKACLLSETVLKVAEPERVGGRTGNGLCYGLVGPNGCGKSTLLKLMANGSLFLPESWDTVIVNQELPAATSKSPVEEVLDAHPRRAALLTQIATVEEDLLDLAPQDAEAWAESSERLKALHGELNQWDGEERVVADILISLGFLAGEARVAGAPSLATPLCHLSGGWQMKVQLAKALWLKPRLLLLDEPSNHLDFRALSWLQEQLLAYPHTVVVVSHDIQFLHESCSEILWINEKRIEALPRDMVTQEDLARMQRRRSLDFRFLAAENAADHGISFHGVTFGHDKSNPKTPLLRVPGDVRLTGCSRSVMLGKNGSGKSTFLELCAGRLSPDFGTIDRTAECKVGYYSQLNGELDQGNGETAVAYITRVCRDVLSAKLGLLTSDGLAAADERRLAEHARGALARFGIEGDVAVSVPVNRLSGGQKACIKFAALALRPVHILLLDEPTNHLDAEAREALATGLAAFRGGVVVVTHDDALIYRLIQCNWSDGELVVCQAGTVHRERAFGAHRLKSLKEQVRRAEAVEASISGPSNKCRRNIRPAKLEVPKDVLPTRLFDPLMPPGFKRVSIKEPQAKNEANEVSPGSKVPARKCVGRDQSAAVRALPRPAAPEPYAQRDVADICAEQAASRGIEVENKKSKEVDVLKSSQARKHLGCEAALRLECDASGGRCVISDVLMSHEPLDIALRHVDVSSPEEVSCVDDVQVSKKPIAAVQLMREVVSCTSPACADIPDSWLDLVDDEVSPDQATRAEENHSAKPCAAGDSVGAAIANDRSPISFHSTDIACVSPLNYVVSKPKLADAQGLCDVVSGPRSVEPRVASPLALKAQRSGRSRQRKNWVNLNKAVLKWQKQVSNGTLTEATLHARIVSSPVALHLQDVHGENFRQDEFLRDVLRHAAEYQDVRRVAVGGA